MHRPNRVILRPPAASPRRRSRNFASFAFPPWWRPAPGRSGPRRAAQKEQTRSPPRRFEERADRLRHDAAPPRLRGVTRRQAILAPLIGGVGSVALNGYAFAYAPAVELECDALSHRARAMAKRPGVAHCRAHRSAFRGAFRLARAARRNRRHDQCALPGSDLRARGFRARPPLRLAARCRVPIGRARSPPSRRRSAFIPCLATMIGGRMPRRN